MTEAERRLYAAMVAYEAAVALGAREAALRAHLEKIHVARLAAL